MLNKKDKVTKNVVQVTSYYFILVFAANSVHHTTFSETLSLEFSLTDVLF